MSIRLFSNVNFLTFTKKDTNGCYANSVLQGVVRMVSINSFVTKVDCHRRRLGRCQHCGRNYPFNVENRIIPNQSRLEICAISSARLDCRPVNIAELNSKMLNYFFLICCKICLKRRKYCTNLNSLAIELATLANLNIISKNNLLIRLSIYTRLILETNKILKNFYEI